MPLTIGPYTLTIIKEDGTEMDYVKKDLVGNKTIRINFKYSDIIDISAQLESVPTYGYQYRTSKNNYLYLPLKLELQLSSNELLLIVSDTFKFTVNGANTWINKNLEYDLIDYICITDHYYSGLRVRAYNHHNNQEPLLYDTDKEMDKLVILILGISELDVQLANTLLELE